MAWASGLRRLRRHPDPAAASARRQRTQFHLTEIYLARDQGARFDDLGHWQRQANLLQLQGASGSLRVYALLPDGRLQPRDGHGAALSPDTGETLEMVPPSDDP